MVEIQKQYETLTKAEAKKLSTLLREKHGNAKACSEIAGVHINTLKRAKDGLEIKPEKAKAIREKLLVNQLEVA